MNMKGYSLMTLRKPFPAWAKTFLGEECLFKIEQLFELGSEFDSILQGCDRATTLRSCRDSQDMRVLSALLVETCDDVYARIRTRCAHLEAKPFVARAEKSIHDILGAELGQERVICHDIAVAMILTMRDRAGLEMYLRERSRYSRQIQAQYQKADIAKARIQLLTMPRPTDEQEAVNWDVIQILGNWCSLKMTLERLRELDGGTSLPPFKEEDRQLAEDLALELIDFSRVLGLRRLLTNVLFAERGDPYEIAMYPAAENVENGLFSDHAACFIVVNGQTEPVQYFRRTGKIIYERQTSFLLNNSGRADLCAPTFMPAMKSPIGTENIQFFQRLLLHVFLDLHDVHQQIFDSVEKGDMEARNGKGVAIPLPIRAQGFPQTATFDEGSETEAFIPAPASEVKERVVSHKRLKLQMPSLTANEILRSLHRLGCVTVRQTGSHVLLQAPNGERRIIPQHNKKVIGIGGLCKVLSVFGIDRAEFLEHL